MPFKNCKNINIYIPFLFLGAGAVIHTHSKAAVMATLLYPGSEFTITHQEMIKGIQKCSSGGYYRYIFKSRDVLFDCLFAAK